MKQIPPGHTLRVAIACLKAAKPKVNPTVLEELSKIAERESAKDDVRERIDDDRRIERQRTIWAMLPDTTAKDRLRDAMISRAWDLLDGGECEACDALLEFVPSKDADKMLREYFPDQE